MKMFKTQRNFVEVEDVLYEILKVIPESLAPVVDTWKEHLQADKVFKREDVYFFMREVPDLEILTEEYPDAKNEEQNTEEVRNEAESELIAAGKPTSGVEELIGYKWKQDADKDEPEETNDHFCDQMRYVTRYLENNEGIGDAIRDANRANAGRTMTDRLPAGTFRKHRR
jgi:thymidylate synthase